MAQVQCPNCSSYKTETQRSSMQAGLFALFLIPPLWILLPFAIYRYYQFKENDYTCNVCGFNWEE